MIRQVGIEDGVGEERGGGGGGAVAMIAPKLSRCHPSGAENERGRGGKRRDARYSLGPPGALTQHPGLSGPALQMSSPGTARLDPHDHSSPSRSLLTASPYSPSLTSHDGNSCMHTFSSPADADPGFRSPVALRVEEK